MTDPNTLLLFSLIIVLVFAASKITFKFTKSARFLHFLRTGIVYIIIGALIGPFSGVVEQNYFVELSPLILFALGWIGFLYGSHLEWESLKQFHWSSYVFTFGHSMVVLGGVSVISGFLLHWLTSLGLGLELYCTSMLLGLVAANTAPAVVFLTSRRVRTSPTMSLMQFSAALDDFPSIFGIAFIFIIHYTMQFGGGVGDIALLFGLSTILGVVFGLILKSLLTTTSDPKVETMLLLALLFLVAGLTAYLHLSTIYTTMIMGITFANTSKQKEDVYAILAEREHAIYALLLVLSGAMILPSSEWFSYVFVVLPIFLLLRFLLKYCGCYLLIVGSGNRLQANPKIGLGLMAQGGMAIPLAISYHRAFGEEYTSSELVFVLVVLAVIINEFISSYTTKRLLKLEQGAQSYTTQQLIRSEYEEPQS